MEELNLDIYRNLDRETFEIALYRDIAMLDLGQGPLPPSPSPPSSPIFLKYTILYIVINFKNKITLDPPLTISVILFMAIQIFIELNGN